MNSRRRVNSDVMLPRILSIGLIAGLGFYATAQSPTQKPSTVKLSFEFENDCGNPLVESMAWSALRGRVTKVIAGDTIVIQTAKRQRKRVSLVAVNASSNEDAARAELSRLVLNRDVTVLVNPSDADSSSVPGVVSLGVKDMNRTLIETGLARYREPEFYAVSRYRACVYRILEKHSREAKRGLWKTASN